MTEQVKKSNWYRWPFAFMGTVFVGAIGSGLWEIFLRDAVNLSFTSLASGFGAIFSSYLDSLHENIGKAYQNEMTVLPFILCVAIIVVINLIGLIYLIKVRSIRARPKARETTFRAAPSFRDKRFWLMVVMMTVNVVTYSSMALTANYRIKAIVWTERSIEILHPHLSDAEFLTMRAEYRSVDGAAAFYSLHERLLKMASQAKVKLPEFAMIGSPSSMSHSGK